MWKLSERIETYLRRAEACRRAAETTKEPGIRALYLDLASH